MTKPELEARLRAGELLDEILSLRTGQECMIFKADSFQTGAEILYIPDVYLNEIPLHIPLNVPNSLAKANSRKWEPMSVEEQIEEVLSCCYSGDDFVTEMDGDVELAERLFWYVDWQHPSSAAPEIGDDE